MKKIIQKYFLLLFIVTSFSATAQQYQLDSVVKTIKDKQFIISQKYNLEKKQAETIEYEKSKFGSEIHKISKINTQYDKNGNETETSYSIWNSNTNRWDEDEKTETEYDAQQILIGSTNFRNENGKMQAKFGYKRLKVNDTIFEINLELRENILKPVHKTLTLNNASNNAIFLKIILWNDTLRKWENYYKTENHYKNDTTLIGFEAYEWKQNKWKKNEKVEYYFDEKNSNVNNYASFSGENNEWIPKNKFENVVLKEQSKEINNNYSWSNENKDWYISSQVIIYFNEKGEKQNVDFLGIDELSKQSNLQSEQLNLYDDQGRLTLRQDILHTDGETTGIQNTTKYDELGNIYLQANFELDSEKDKWENKFETEYIFDKNIVIGSEDDYKKLDFFKLNEHQYIGNKHAVKQVKVYEFINRKKNLYEVYEYFYSKVK